MLGSAGQYVLRRRLAAGGMGEVFLASDQSVAGVERRIVVKQLFANFARDPQIAKMFEHEARVLAEMAHPVIPQVYAYAAHESAPYIAMEYSPGVDLAVVLARGEPVPASHAVTIALQLLEGLAHVHERRTADGKLLGVVHRDVAPSNIRIGPDGWLTLLDFGVAQSVLLAPEAGNMRGSPGYLAPEAITSGAVDHRADLFAVGIVLHEMLTGARLFPGSAVVSMQTIVEAPLDAPSKHVASVPSSLDDLVSHALERDPDARFRSAGAMAEALEAAAFAARLEPSRLRLARWLASTIAPA
jgi:serine/threonine protein kinase